MPIPIKTIHFNNISHEGIVDFIQNENNEEDILSKGIVSISYHPKDSYSKDPGVMFGIGNPSLNDYFSTEFTTAETKFILFDFIKYSIAFEGVSIYTGYTDWYRNYFIKTSYDNFKTDSKRILHCDRKYNTGWVHFPMKKTKPSRFFNISVTGTSLEPRSNFAIYRIEFFGDVYKTSRDIVCMFCTCQKSKIPQLKFLLPLSFVTFVQ